MNLLVRSVITACSLSFLASGTFARPAAEPIRELTYDMANGGINPEFRSLDLSGVVTVRNGCMSARFVQDITDNTVYVRAEQFNAMPGRLCTMALKDVEVTATVNFAASKEVIVLNANGEDELVVWEGETEPQVELVDTVARNAWITLEAGKVFLHAELLQGTNPCTAKGVKVGWKEEKVGRQTVIIPHRTKAAPTFCSREYNPQYHVLKTEVKNPRVTVLKHHKKLGNMTPVRFFMPLAQSVQSGGFCRGRCPTIVLHVNRRGTVFSITQTYDANDFNKAPKVEVDVMKRLSRGELHEIRQLVRSVRPGKILDEQEGQPICMDIPLVTYAAYNPYYGVVSLGKDQNCHAYRLAQEAARALVDELNNFR
jgi:hypothetical protein